MAAREESSGKISEPVKKVVKALTEPVGDTPGKVGKTKMAEGAEDRQEGASAETERRRE